MLTLDLFSMAAESDAGNDSELQLPPPLGRTSRQLERDLLVQALER